MALASTAPLPGSMTVPPLHGWEVLLTVLGVLVVVGLGVAVLLASAAGTAAEDRSEWESWLDGRSRIQPEPAAAGQGRAPNAGGPVSSGSTP